MWTQTTVSGRSKCLILKTIRITVVSLAFEINKMEKFLQYLVYSATIRPNYDKSLKRAKLFQVIPFVDIFPLVDIFG